MRILIAPLNWGLGHASRCIPLIQRWLDEGHEVVIGGDGASFSLLRTHFPQLRYVYLAPLELRYSRGKSQVWAMVRAVPKVVYWAFKDHAMLRSILQEEAFDRVVSDNRFGFYCRATESIYITHQLWVHLPKGWRWAEKIASCVHACICDKYNKVWVPDIEDLHRSLAGSLSHPKRVKPSVAKKIEYIGPLSRFSKRDECSPSASWDIVALLSGLEPQRSLFEKEIIVRYQQTSQKTLIIQGLLGKPKTRLSRQNITIVPYLNDDEIQKALCSAKHIIARSGYSTIMDLYALGLLAQAELIATPGQSEQEYLSSWHSGIVEA